MTTATNKTTTASGELRKIQADRDRLHAKVLEAKGKVATYDAETQAKRVELSEHQHTHTDEWEGTPKRAKPNTPAAKLETEVRARWNSPNPFQAEYEEAFGPYERADLDYKLGSASARRTAFRRSPQTLTRTDSARASSRCARL